MNIKLPEHIEREQGIETPCQRICVLDEASGLCLGCGRTVAEVAEWLDYTAHKRRRIMQVLPQRLKAMKGARKKAARARRQRNPKPKV